MNKASAQSKNATAVLKLQEIGKEDDPSHPTRVEQILNNTPGVSKVDINHLTNILSVEYDPRKISLDEIRQAIEKARA